MPRLIAVIGRMIIEWRGSILERYCKRSESRGGTKSWYRIRWSHLSDILVISDYL